MGDPAFATARHVDELVEVYLPGLPTPPPEDDWTEGPCQPLMYGCTGAPHRPGCNERALPNTC